jgi:hypothetical protein
VRLGADQPLVAPGSGPHKGHAVPQFATNSGHKASSTQLAAFVTNTAHPNVGLPPRHPAGIVRAGGPIPGQACPGQAAKMFTSWPGSRYRTLQWLETGIFVAVALLAAAGFY